MTPNKPGTDPIPHPLNNFVPPSNIARLWQCSHQLDMDTTSLDATPTMGNDTIRRCTISWAMDTSIKK